MIVTKLVPTHRIDYTKLTVGSPVGRQLVIICPKCARPGVRSGTSKTVIHGLSYWKVKQGQADEQNETSIFDSCEDCDFEKKRKPTQYSWGWRDK